MSVMITEQKSKVKNVADAYYRMRNDFLLSFGDTTLRQFDIFFEQEKQKIKQALSSDFYQERTILVGGIPCQIRDEDAIKKHYSDLETKLNFLETKRKENRENLLKEYLKIVSQSERIMKVEQELAIKGLQYEAILPTEALNSLIENIPLYVFKLNERGELLVPIPGLKRGDDEKEKHFQEKLLKIVAGKGLFIQGKKSLYKKILFGKRNLVPERNYPWVFSDNPDRNKRCWFKITFPQPNRAVQNKIAAFHNTGYTPYTIAHEDAFTATALKIVNPVIPDGDPISVVDIGDVSVLIVQYGNFPMEKQLIEEAKKYFQNIRDKAFSLN